MKHRDFAKVITKVLRASGIKAGIVNDNGTTSPPGRDKFEAYIPVKKNNEYKFGDERLFMSFDLDEGTIQSRTMDKITHVLNQEGFIYGHRGDEYSCFTFIPYKVEVCCRCKKHLAEYGWTSNDSGKGVCSSCIKKSQGAS